MKYKKIVELPTGIITKICTSLEGTINIEADGYLRAKWVNNEAFFKPLNNFL